MRRGVAVLSDGAMVGGASSAVCILRHLAAGIAEDGRLENRITHEIAAGAPPKRTDPPDAATKVRLHASTSKGRG